MKWKDLKKHIDWIKVEDEIIAHQAKFISTDRLRTANKLVHDAAEYFLPLDLKWFKITGIEKEYEYTYSSELIPDRGIIDLIFEIKTDAGKPYKDYVGETLVVDWKSTGGELNTDWRNRYIPSWQWKRYAEATKAKLFEYRGVSTKTYFDGQGYKQVCGPIIIEVPENNSINVQTDYKATQYSKLGISDLSVYPRNAPSACYKFGETCPEKEDCDTFAMPQEKLVNIKHASYSSDELFKLCPEKYRRYKLRGVKEEDYESNSFLGTMFHRGIAEVYKQIKEEN